MANINSNKNAIIFQPITLQIRAPFQFLTNQRAIKHTHYSESRDGLNGRCSFSAVCGKRVHSWTVSSTTKAIKLNRFHLFFTYISTSYSSSEEHPFFSMTWHAKYCTDIYLHRVRQLGSRLMAKEEKSTFQISSLLLSSFISNIYTPEKGYYWQNQPNSLKVKGYQEANSNVKQLLH